jgi:hypothetical protein
MSKFAATGRRTKSVQQNNHKPSYISHKHAFTGIDETVQSCNNAVADGLMPDSTQKAITILQLRAFLTVQRAD